MHKIQTYIIVLYTRGKAKHTEDINAMNIKVHGQNPADMQFE